MTDAQDDWLAPYVALLFVDEPLDVAIEHWRSDVHAATAGWTAAFVEADDAAARGDRAAAVAALRPVTEDEGLEPRLGLWAWRALRALGVEPPDDVADRVDGVVVEVPVAAGVDHLAVYADGTARYLNHEGGAIVWDEPDERTFAHSDAVVDLAEEALAWFGPPGPRHEQRPPAVRLSALTPAGIRQHTMTPGGDDPPAVAAAFAAASELLSVLVAVAVAEAEAADAEV